VYRLLTVSEHTVYSKGVDPQRFFWARVSAIILVGTQQPVGPLAYLVFITRGFLSYFKSVLEA